MNLFIERLYQIFLISGTVYLVGWCNSYGWTFVGMIFLWIFSYSKITKD